MPFSGPAPRYVIHLAPESPRWLCVDMQASRLADGQPRRGGTASPRLLAWMLVPRPPERVRLYARLARRVQLEASLEPAAQQLHLRLHGAEARPASPAPKPLTPSRDQPSLDFPGPFLREPEPPQEPQEPTPAEQPVIEEVL
ncbi:MAG: hypothetical protein VKP62_05015 [Candidatus Sericytochromatia bacterium]|nr:hypothetical protein [Candidatus Sericytochromatia bacterium]